MNSRSWKTSISQSTRLLDVQSRSRRSFNSNEPENGHRLDWPIEEWKRTKKESCSDQSAFDEIPSASSRETDASSKGRWSSAGRQVSRNDEATGARSRSRSPVAITIRLMTERAPGVVIQQLLDEIKYFFFHHHQREQRAFWIELRRISNQVCDFISDAILDLWNIEELRIVIFQYPSKRKARFGAGIHSSALCECSPFVLVLCFVWRATTSMASQILLSGDRSFPYFPRYADEALQKTKRLFRIMGKCFGFRQKEMRERAGGHHFRRRPVLLVWKSK